MKKMITATTINTIFMIGLPDLAAGAGTGAPETTGAAPAGGAANGAGGWIAEGWLAAAGGAPATAPQVVQNCIPSPIGAPHFVQN
jgi:hypothetical protein